MATLHHILMPLQIQKNAAFSYIPRMHSFVHFLDFWRFIVYCYYY